MAQLAFLQPAPLMPSRRRRLTAPRRRHRRTACEAAAALTPVALPWQSAASLSRGMLTTSFETCTAQSVAYPTPYHLRAALDCVTCAIYTNDQHRRLGQWVWVKPWGDEDGNIAPCMLSHAPDGRAIIDAHFRRGTPVCDAVEAGEMLEVSEVCGAGFDGDVAAAATRAADIWMFAACETVLALLPPLRAARAAGARVRVFVCVGRGCVDAFTDMYELDADDTVVDYGGACCELLEAAAGEPPLSCACLPVPEGGGFDAVAASLGPAPSACVAVVACPWDQLRDALVARCGIERRNVFVNR
jgi:hypothetical protein